MTEASKDTIYIDIDDEITSIIDKVRTSKHKILALVLPKRATVLQSIVNMKLLKRTAETDKKHIVLITSEASLLPLAGAVGLHVAKTLQSKPAVPKPPEKPGAEESIVDEEVPAISDAPKLDESKPVGELAGLLPEPEDVATIAPAEETININNSDADEDVDKGGKTKDKSKSKIKVPNFNKFRFWLVLGVVSLVALIVAWYVMFNVLPKATVTIKTNNQSVNTTVSFTADTDVKKLDAANRLVPAQVEDAKETATQTSPASGKKNIGNKAAGAVTMTTSTNCITPVGTVSAGQGITTAGLTFITQEQATFSPTSVQGGKCYWSSNNVSVVAAQGGSQYNVAANSTFSVVSGVTATNGVTFTGGTDNTVTVIAQSDIDGAKQKITANTTQALTDLTKSLKAAGEIPLTVTLVADDPTVTTSANVGDQVSQVTVTVVTTYHMLGVQQSDLDALAKNSVKDQIDIKRQQISDTGVGAATFTQTSKASNTQQVLSLQTTVVAGAEINIASLQTQLAGKKKGDAQQIIQGLPSVDGATIQFSPFWVSSFPGKASRITIVVQKPAVKTNASVSK